MPFKKIKDVLRQNNLRPTNQRIAIFNILFKEENWHFSADIVEKKCSEKGIKISAGTIYNCLLYTSPSPRDRTRSRMPSSA